MALTYEDMRQYNRTMDLVVNRCKCINGIGEGLITLCYRRGLYRLDYLGRELAAWKLYDVQGVRDAFIKTDACFDVLWETRRAGLMSMA